MQGLASYGSDEEDDLSSVHPSAAPVASCSSEASTQSIAKSSTASPALNPSVSRIKGLASSASSSRAQSPLSGVKLAAPAALAPSAAKLGKRRESSSSPPRYERSAPPPQAGEDEGEDGVGPSNGGSAAPRGVRLDALAEFGIPPLPTGPCKSSVEAKLTNFHHLRQTRGLHFNDSLNASKAFRNPRIYAKLVEFVDVDETGTNWDKEVWDPKDVGLDGTAVRLAELQKIRSEAKAAQPAGSRSAIAFTGSSSTSSSSRHKDDERRYRDDRNRDHDRERDRERDRSRGGGDERKKSRWDKGGRDRSRSPRRR
ncbi:hypothetical protein JCM11251_001590 [Rhodosporidiobolus azoricus]